MTSEPRPDGRLSIVEVSARECVLSNGEILFLRYEKLRYLCEQLCQEEAEIKAIRTWWTGADGNELIEIHRKPHHMDALPINAIFTAIAVF